MHLIWPLVSGVIFSVGLIISGMINPVKVASFLDIAGNWDPSLAFVMGGALLTTALGYRFVLKRSAPLYTDKHYLPETTAITPELLMGSAFFGIGWGLAGLCPGPALAVFPMSLPIILPFAIGLLAGIFAYQGYERAKHSVA